MYILFVRDDSGSMDILLGVGDMMPRLRFLSEYFFIKFLLNVLFIYFDIYLNISGGGGVKP